MSRVCLGKMIDFKVKFEEARPFPPTDRAAKASESSASIQADSVLSPDFMSCSDVQFWESIFLAFVWPERVLANCEGVSQEEACHDFLKGSFLTFRSQLPPKASRGWVEKRQAWASNTNVLKALSSLLRTAFTRMLYTAGAIPCKKTEHIVILYNRPVTNDR